MSGLPLVLVLFLLFLAGALWIGGRSLRRESGLPEGEILYSDTGAWRANNEVLHAATWRLAGKPDYLVEQQDGAIVPVEVKSSPAPDAPWEGQVLQLAAYCLLVEETYGIRPPYGILQYSNGAFAIEYTEDLEADLLSVLEDMRATAVESDPVPDHAEWQRCAGCGVRAACDYRLD